MCKGNNNTIMVVLSPGCILFYCVTDKRVTLSAACSGNGHFFFVLHVRIYSLFAPSGLVLPAAAARVTI